MTENNARNPQAAAIFRDRFNGHPNVMTPDIHSHRMIAGGRLAVELSSGAGFRQGEEMWAVTVICVDDKHDHRGTGHELSECFTSRSEAESHIESLRAWRRAEGEDSANA